MFLARERAVAIEAVRKASKVCQTVFAQLVSAETITKKDNSPVTVADYSVQAVINSIIMKEFPGDPIVGEEDAADLRKPDGVVMKNKVVELANSVLETKLSEDEVLNAIDFGMYEGGAKGRHWTLDPIDGTKGFLRGEQFAVCLALIIDGQIRLGVMGCPNLEVDVREPSGPRGCIFIAVEGQGATQRTIDDPAEKTIKVSSATKSSEANFCESVEAGHSNHDDSFKVGEMLGITKAPIRMDSQCKYATIARGDASIYLRLPTRKGYEEKIWDHGSGWLLVHEAGGKVTDCAGKPLDFSIGRTLKNNVGVVATNGAIHAEVSEAVQTVLKSSGHL